jgi:hypothetical protein
MDQQKKFSLINRISTGIIFQSVEGNLYKLLPPDNEIKALSEFVYQEMLYNTKFDQLINKSQASYFLQKKNIWIPSDEKKLEDNNKFIDELKIALYKSLYNNKEQKQIRKKISIVQKNINKLLMAKHSLDYMTLENFSETIRDEFLIANCIHTLDNQKVYNYNNFWQSDSTILNKFTTFIQMNVISSEEYREIARSEPFRSLWLISKSDIFSKPSLELTLDQKNMILYSKMYDNVYESQDRPSDEVIEDDLMLDGWFSFQKKKNELERKQKEVDDLLNKKGSNSGAGDVFVMSPSRDEAKRVGELNDLNAKMKLKQRRNQIEKQGVVSEEKFADVKMDLRNQAMQKMANRFKG